jgi:polysaccharide transporter, PST family
LRTKFYAIYLDVNGVGISSQLLNFNNLIIFVGTLGIPLGLTKYVSEWGKDSNWSEIKETISKFVVILLILAICLLILTILLSKQISSLILDSDSYSLFIIIISLAFPFSALTSIFEASLRGLKKFDQYVKATIITSVLSLVLSIITVIVWGITGVAISILFSSVINLAVLGYFFNQTLVFKLKDFMVSSLSIPKSLKLVLSIGLAGLIDQLLIQLTILLIRSTIIKQLGINSNGVYQAIYVISNNYINLFFMSLGIYALPILSELKNKKSVNDEVNNILKFTIFVIFPIITFTFILRYYVVIILFSSKFINATDFFVFNFFGDYFKALSWVLGAWLIPQTKVKLWLTLGIIYNILYFSVFYILINFFFFDLRSVVFSYAFVNLFHFAINLYFIRKINSFKFNADVFKLMIISTIFFLCLLIVSSISYFWGYVLALPVFVLWFKFNISKEDYLKYLKLIKLKLNLN